MLNSEKIEYLVVGGVAVAYYGYPRATGDLDIWIALHPGNVSRIVSVLHQFGFSSATEEVFMTPGHIVRMGVPPVRLELLNSISGVDFDTCWQRRVDAILDGIPVPMISREDLISNKRAAAREKDLNDIKQLEKRQSK